GRAGAGAGCAGAVLLVGEGTIAPTGSRTGSPTGSATGSPIGFSRTSLLMTGSSLRLVPLSLGTTVGVAVAPLSAGASGVDSGSGWSAAGRAVSEISEGPGSAGAALGTRAGLREVSTGEGKLA